MSGGRVCCLFKRKTADEVRIRDWSSDVCSSDLDRVDGVARRRVEFGGDAGLVTAVTDQAGIGAGAERQAEGIEQDRLAGPGLTGQHRQPRREGEVETVDEHHVPDRERGEHGSERAERSEEHTSELQSLMRTSYAVSCLQKTTNN